METSAQTAIVFQGPIKCGDEDGPSTAECIRRTRSALPAAQIIISTWSWDPNIAALVDKYIVNTDPGPLIEKPDRLNYLNNINRQIVSTSAGLKGSSRPIAIKLRSDCYLSDAAIVNTWQKYCRVMSPASCFGTRLGISSCGCVDPKVWPALFFVSDFFQIGATRDLIILWSCPMCPQEWGSWHYKSSVSRWRTGLVNHYEYFAPEQYVWSTFLKSRNDAAELDALLVFNKERYHLSESRFINNFIAAPSKFWGLVLPDRLQKIERLAVRVNREDWKQLLTLNTSRDRDAQRRYITVGWRRYAFAAGKTMTTYYLRDVPRSYCARLVARLAKNISS
jgi:hypothetical protein